MAMASRILSSVIRSTVIRQLLKSKQLNSAPVVGNILKSADLRAAFFGTSSQLHSHVKQVENGIEFNVGDLTEYRFVDYLWLYDNCRCPKCFMANVNQKLGDPRFVTPDIKPKSLELSGDNLQITWSDDHGHTYDLKWILANIYGGIPQQPKLKPRLWKSLKPEEFPKVEYSPNIKREELVKQILSNIVVYGFTLITNVDPTFEATDDIFRSIAPIQKGYFWGEVFTIQPQEEFPDNAFTNDYLPPHTDAAHILEAPGVQLIHILKKSSDGGESTLCDSFNIAEELKKRDPESYNFITTTPVESSYKADMLQVHYKHCETILRLHPFTKEMLQIRFNPTDILPIKTIPQREIRKWYKSFGSLVTELYDPSNGIEFVLHPGTMLVFDNWRLLHGRKSFVGHRQLCGGFISHTEFKSRARQLGLVD
ncbi:hypothetical protein CHUAL_010477 [Chamberlinius hualienensis]